MLSQTILRPFAYLKIQHHSKWVVDWGIPLILAVLITLITGLGDLYSDKHLSWNLLENNIASLAGILPGFYIAALAAIVAFNRNDIDEHMPEPTPIIKSYLGDIISLTRRRFLALTFSFLTAESITLMILIGLGPSLNSIIEHLVNNERLSTGLWYVYIFILYTIFSQLVTVTFLCLYYLGERLHQPDP